MKITIGIAVLVILALPETTRAAYESLPALVERVPTADEKRREAAAERRTRAQNKAPAEQPMEGPFYREIHGWSPAVSEEKGEMIRQNAIHFVKDPKPQPQLRGAALAGKKRAAVAGPPQLPVSTPYDRDDVRYPPFVRHETGPDPILSGMVSRLRGAPEYRGNPEFYSYEKPAADRASRYSDFQRMPEAYQHWHVPGGLPRLPF